MSAPSLVSGWLPITVQVGVAMLAVVAVGWRPPPWRRRRALLALGAGLATVILAKMVVEGSGLASSPTPPRFWAWIGVAVAAAVVVGVGWSCVGWSRRVVAVLVVPLSLVCAGLVANQWTGYISTTSQAWEQFTGAPVAGQISSEQLAGLRARRPALAGGQVVAVTIPATASGFTHRGEFVYLPPVWFTGPAPAATLPVIMMIGAELSTPADWVRAGQAVSTADGYARDHGGYGPILVFVDAAGSVSNDTECVNGPRGNSADHLTRDVRPWAISQLGATPEAARWSVVGWSMGGTCAVDLAVMHPELFATFQDISGDLGRAPRKPSLTPRPGSPPAAARRPTPGRVADPHQQHRTAPPVGDQPATTRKEALRC
jgi:S-formylglutathione hydrolase FrmB